MLQLQGKASGNLALTNFGSWKHTLMLIGPPIKATGSQLLAVFIFSMDPTFLVQQGLNESSPLAPVKVNYTALSVACATPSTFEEFWSSC